MVTLPLTDRVSAGQALGQQLKDYQQSEDPLVIALPRGGVPVAYQIAKSLNAPLDVMIVRKLGLPHHKEYAMGAIASGGVQILMDNVVSANRVSLEEIQRVVIQEKQELERREKIYRQQRSWPDLHARCVILVDDGVATGATMVAAIRAVRDQGAKKIIAAVPVAPRETAEEISALVDEAVFLATPQPFYAVGQWYKKFEQTTDEEVQSLLAEFWSEAEGTR